MHCSVSTKSDKEETISNGLTSYTFCETGDSAERGILVGHQLKERQESQLTCCIQTDWMANQFTNGCKRARGEEKGRWDLGRAGGNREHA